MGPDLLFAMGLALIICRAVWDETYCLVTGKESARQKRIKKRIEDGKPTLGDVAVDALNNLLNGDRSTPSSGADKDPSPSKKFWDGWWGNFWDYWDQWWGDVWEEAKRRRREKHRQRVEDRIREERESGGPRDVLPPAPVAPNAPTGPPEAPEPTPSEPEPQAGPPPRQDPPVGEPPPDPWERMGAYVPPPPMEPNRVIQATAVVIRPVPPSPRALPAGERPALGTAPRAIAPPQQNGSTTMAGTTVVGAANAVSRMAADDTDPEATKLLGGDLNKLSKYLSDLFEDRAWGLADVGVGGQTQEILCDIQDAFDGLIILAKKLEARGERHADLADHVDEVGDVDAGKYLMRNKPLRQLRRRTTVAKTN